MRVPFIGLTCLLLAVAVVGCNRTSPPGGPGKDAAEKDKATRDNTPAKRDNVADSNNTFTVSVSKATSVTQGSMNPETVSISRGSAFKQKVTLNFKADGKGVKVEPPTAELKADDTKVAVNVVADADATVGDHIIAVTGTPETGPKTDVNWTVTVKAK